MNNLQILIAESGFHEKLDDLIAKLKNGAYVRKKLGRSPLYNVEVNYGDHKGNHIRNMWTIKYKALKIFSNTQYVEIKINEYHADGNHVGFYTNPPDDQNSRYIGFQAIGSSHNPDTNKAIFINCMSDADKFFLDLDENLKFIWT